jgi:hypothetical protein
MHLVVVDTAQIQPYIFGSNRLRENIGASHLESFSNDLIHRNLPGSSLSTVSR